MKVLIDGRVLNHEKTTGIEIHIINLIKELTSSIEITIAKPRFNNKFYAHFWEHCILPYKANNYDILFCPSNIAPLFLSKKVKLVYTLHDLSFLDFPENYSKLFQCYYSYIVPKNLKRADSVLTVSHFAMNTIIAKFPFVKNKIKHIYNGVDQSFLNSGRNRIKKDTYILFIGSMSKIKNYQSVIKAFLLLKIDIKLKMIMPTLDSFSEYNIHMVKDEKIEVIEFIEHQNLCNFYKKARLFIYPSLYDSFGLPVLEAMACGTPVVTSNIAALPEVGGDAVLYCDPYNVEDISQKIEQILGDTSLQEQMSKKGLARAKEFSWEKSAQEHIRVFEEVLKV